MFECPKCKSNNIDILTETYKGHEVKALCLCTNCLTGFEYWKMWLEQQRTYIEHHRIIKYDTEKAKAEREAAKAEGG